MRAFGYSKHGPAAVQEGFSNQPLPEIGNVATGLRIKVRARNKQACKRWPTAHVVPFSC